VKIFAHVASERRQRENVAMTVLTSRNGTDHPLLQYLPKFTCNKDRAVVLNLLCNVSGLCVDGYKDISRRSLEEIQLLVERGVKSSDCGQWTFDFSGKGLFAVDLEELLLTAVGVLQGAPSEVQVRWELAREFCKLNFLNILSSMFCFIPFWVGGNVLVGASVNVQPDRQPFGVQCWPRTVSSHAVSTS
jgi:hypothetical protein